MILKDLHIKCFRNYESLNLSLSPTINIIYGNNAQGKTNLLESIYVLAFTGSYRLTSDSELVKEGMKKSLIKATMVSSDMDTLLQISLNEREKIKKIDGEIIRKQKDYIGVLNVIIFYPEDLFLIKGPPMERRNFLNHEISQINREYFQVLIDYQKILKIRNDYLKKKQKKEFVNESYFDIITSYLIDKGELLYKVRWKYILRINQYMKDIYQDISGLSNFKIVYEKQLSFESLEEPIKNQFIEELKNKKEEEIQLGTTLVGPHRDDFAFYLNDHNLKQFGSQGQQRLAILAFKLAELKLFEIYKKEMPILLLDDVFSELDDEKKANLMRYIDQNIQVIITTTDLNAFDQSILKRAKLIHIENGQVLEEE